MKRTWKHGIIAMPRVEDLVVWRMWLWLHLGWIRIFNTKPQQWLVSSQSQRLTLRSKEVSTWIWFLAYNYGIYIELLKLIGKDCDKSGSRAKMVKHLFEFIGHSLTECANSFCCSSPSKKKSGTKQSWPNISSVHKNRRFDPAKPPPQTISGTFSSLLSKHKSQPMKSMNPSIKQGPRSVYPCSWSVGRHRPQLSKRGVEGDPCDSDEAGELITSSLRRPGKIEDQHFNLLANKTL